MTMPLGFSAVVMVGMVVLVGGDLMVVDDSNWWETCKGPVCTVAENQAEGLARLRVLSNYIKETMILMGTVVESLDKEMLEVGRELHGIVGRQCYARGHTALNTLVNHINQTETDTGVFEVTSDNDDSWTYGSDMTQESTSEWSSDGDVMSGSSSTSHNFSQRPSSTLRGNYHGTSQRPVSSSHGTHQQTTSSTTSTWRGVSQDPSVSSQTTSWHHGSDSQISSTSSSSSSHSSNIIPHNKGRTLHHRPTSTQKEYEGVPTAQSGSMYVVPAVPESIDRQRGRGRGAKHGQGNGPEQGSGLGRGHAGIPVAGRIQGLGGLASLESGPPKCWGVPPGSQHYVPGLDNWCASSCAAGSCPPTHCICS